MAYSMLSPRIIAHTGKKCTATAILFHGSGGTGSDLQTALHMLLREELSFPHIRVVYPTAPSRPYSLANGQDSSVWFDRLSLGPDGTEQRHSVLAMATQLGELIEEEMKKGVPLERIVLGGFSMGGAMALHLGYNFYPQVAGVLGMSCFLNHDSAIYDTLKERDADARLPPLLQFHGDADDLVLHQWGLATHQRLVSLGVTGQFLTLEGLGHSINPTMAREARDFILKHLPSV